MTAPDSDRPADVEAWFDDFQRRRDAGEQPDFEALCAEHPEAASQLREMGARLDALHAILPGPFEKSLSREPFSVHLAPSELLARLRDAGPRSWRYQRIDEIGRGGMGTVSSAWDSELRRRIAMKVAHSRASAVDADGAAPRRATVDRFLEEAQITSQLDHPGIVPVHEIGLTSDGSLYYTMRLVQGEDLRVVFDHVRAGTGEWTLVRVVGVLIRVCEAMSFAHSKGVIHRDLKPANVMVGGFGEVYVMDWGLARVLAAPTRRPPPPPDVLPRRETGAVESERLDRRSRDPASPLMTMDGDAIGTPSYMSPEQAAGQVDRLGPRSDVYSIGAMLFELLGGERPYAILGEQTSFRTLIARVVEGPPRTIRPDVLRAPAELIAICDRAMARAMEQRYPDTQSLANDLRAWVEGRVVGAFETGAWAEARKWVKRNRALAAALAAALAVLVLCAVLAKSYFDGEARKQQVALADRVAHTRQLLREFRSEWSDWKSVAAIRQPVWNWWQVAARTLIAGTFGDTGASTGAVGLDECRKELDEIRGRALPATKEELKDRREKHPLNESFTRKRLENQWRARMLELERWPTDAEVETSLAEHLAEARAASVAKAGASAPHDVIRRENLRWLNSHAFAMVRPDAPRVPGNEVLAHRIMERVIPEAVADPELKVNCRDTYAFTLFRIARFDEALEMQRAAVADADPVKHAFAFGNLDLLEREIDGWRDGDEKKRMHDLRTAEVRSLELELEADMAGYLDASERRLHGELVRLQAELLELAARLRTVEASVETETARARWSVAITAIRESPLYDRLVLTPQVELLPLGADAESGLWEFAHLPSGEQARRRDDGTLARGEGTGIVFVLVPGGELPVQQDGTATLPRGFRLSPFFLSKYELTMQQWGQLSREWPIDDIGQQIPNPIVHVSFEDCATMLEREGGWIRLPSEAQWELACRAGTTTKWWSGASPDSLRGAEHLRLEGPSGPAFDRSEVGILRANPFGFHDMLGNVQEHCQDHYPNERDQPIDPQPGDGLRERSGLSQHVIRGGSFLNGPESAGPAARFDGVRRRRVDYVGLRPARCLTP